jgi:acyl-CoA thioesterase
MLVDFDPYLVSGGYAHGAARLWAEDGTLLGVASQTATVLLFDPSG